jgi:DUF4097 and DUF4098 domain-containing protein YvlB
MTLRTIAALFTLATLTTAAAAETYQYNWQTLKKVRIENAEGDIQITPLTSAKLSISDSTHLSADKFGCRLNITHPSVEELLVKVDGDCHKKVDMNLELPKDADVEIQGGAGNIGVSGLNGKLDFQTQTGSVDAKGDFTQVDGHSDSGAVKISGIHGSGKLSTKTGNLQLRFLPEAKGEFDVRSTTGAAEMEFPKKSRLAAELRSEKGTIENGLDLNENSDYHLKAKTESGDLTIKEY